MKITTAVAGTFFIFLASFSAQAADDKPTRAEKRLAEIMENYAATGETKACISMQRARRSRIIDDSTIFFEGLRRTGYLNKLVSKCPGLSREERFAYRINITRLCRGDFITVLDSFGRPWGTCLLGEFEEMEKKPKGDAQNDNAPKGPPSANASDENE